MSSNTGVDQLDENQGHWEPVHELCDCRKSTFRPIQQNDLLNVVHFKCDQSQDTPSYICSNEDVLRRGDSEQGGSRHLANGVDDKTYGNQVIEILSFEIQSCTHATNVGGRVTRSAQSKEKPL
jgi:hypothetical protein